MSAVVNDQECFTFIVDSPGDHYHCMYVIMNSILLPTPVYWCLWCNAGAVYVSGVVSNNVLGAIYFSPL